MNRVQDVGELTLDGGPCQERREVKAAYDV